MIHTSGLLRVTDVIKDLRCGVVTIVTLLVDWRNDYSACSTLTCFRKKKDLMIPQKILGDLSRYCEIT